MQISSMSNSSTLLTGLGLMQTESKNTKTETTSEIPFEDVLNGNTTESKDDSSLNYYDENGLSSVNKFEFFANAMRNNTLKEHSTPPTYTLTAEQKEYLNGKYDIENMLPGINDDWMSLMGELVSMNVITRDEGLQTVITPREPAAHRATSENSRFDRHFLSTSSLSYNGLGDNTEIFKNPLDYLKINIDKLEDERDKWFKKIVDYNDDKKDNSEKEYLNTLDVNIDAKKKVMSVIELLK
ncbi:MAG: hypothetical protein LBM93_10530 [Oscillospiraceae bacterium]|jgi:hypothetical protein|nr:hypothetical protein [Oscillospiraceae bacterium]